jgi:uncharacterized protein (DUF1810 family)
MVLPLHGRGVGAVVPRARRRVNRGDDRAVARPVAPRHPGAMDPDRFLEAQHGAFARAIEELRRGRKDGHWMWFVFPQLAGLGRSERSRWFGLAGVEDARAYLAHPVLGARLLEAVSVAMAAGTTDPEALLGPVDALKLRSCLTLFALAADDAAPFEAALARFHGGERDPRTLALLGLSGDVSGTPPGGSSSGRR